MEEEGRGAETPAEQQTELNVKIKHSFQWHSGVADWRISEQVVDCYLQNNLQKSGASLIPKQLDLADLGLKFLYF